MSRIGCQFCLHDNPPGARFCNECGSPLHLKPCPQCETVSDREVRACRQCGFDFAAPPPAVEQDAAIATGDTSANAAPAAATADAEHDAGPVAADAAPMVDEMPTIDIEPTAQPASDPAMPIDVDPSPAALADASDEAPMHVPESFAAALSSQGERIGDFLPGAGRSDASPTQGAEPLAASFGGAAATADIAVLRRGRTRNARLALVVVLALASLAYFAYRPPVAVNEWLAGVQFETLGTVRASVPSLASPAANADAVPSAAPSTTVQPVVARDNATTLATPSDASAAQPAPTPADAAGVQTQPVAAVDARPTDVTDAQAAAPAEAPNDTPARDAKAAQQPTPEVVSEHPPATKAPAPAPRRVATAGRRDARSSTYATTSTALPTNVGPWPAAPPPPARPAERPCTNAVAALGLC